MKKLIGLMLTGVLLFSTSVSFASDGPKITKECVVDSAADMESVVIVGEDSLSTANTVVLGNRFDILFSEAEKAFDKEYELKFPAEYRPKDTLTHIDPGVNVSIFLNYNKKAKTNGKAITYTNKNCRTRELYQSYTC